MKKFNFNLLVLIAIAVICGMLSGLIGVFLLTSGSIPFLSNYNVSQRDADSQIVIDQPRNVLVQQDVQIKQLENSLLPALANIYMKAKSGQGFTDSQILGQGIVLTSDGWILTTQDAITSNSSSTYEAVGYQNKEYSLGSFVQDKETGLVFGKMNGKNLPVVAIGRSKDLALGQTVVVVSQRKKLEVASITKIGYDLNSDKDLIQSSDAFSKQLFLDINMDKGYNGAIVATIKGEVVGIVKNGRVVLSDYFSRTINDVLAGKTISRPELGISYIDLSNTEGAQKLGDQGAYVTDVAKTSSAYGKIKAGDVIKKVNDIELNSFISLSEAINNFSTGNKIELLYSRAGVDASVDVALR